MKSFTEGRSLILKTQMVVKLRMMMTTTMKMMQMILMMMRVMKISLVKEKMMKGIPMMILLPTGMVVVMTRMTMTMMVMRMMRRKRMRKKTKRKKRFSSHLPRRGNEVTSRFFFFFFFLSFVLFPIWGGEGGRVPGSVVYLRSLGDLPSMS